MFNFVGFFLFLGVVAFIPALFAVNKPLLLDCSKLTGR